MTKGKAVAIFAAVVIIATLAGAALLLPHIKPTAPPTPTTSPTTSYQVPARTIKVAGSTSVYPAMLLWAQEYMKLHPNVKIDVAGGGSGKGIMQCAEGLIDIGMHSRPILPGDPKFSNVTFVVANDGVLVVVNKQVPLIGVTKKALQAIFNYPPVNGTPEVYVLAEINGEPKLVKVKVERLGPAGPVKLVGEGIDITLQPYVRSDSSGTAETFAAFLYGSWEAKWNGLQGKGAEGNQGVASAVSSDPHGIGYIAKAFFNPESMKCLLIIKVSDGKWEVYNNYTYNEYHVPEDAAIAEGAAKKALLKPSGAAPGGYPIARELYISVNLDHMPNRRIPSYIAEFIKWIISPNEGQKLVEKVHYVPINEKQYNRDMMLLKQYSVLGS